MILADAESGIGPPLDPHAFGLVNPDLTVCFARLPEGEWIGLRVASYASEDGIGLAESALFDQRGVFGRAAQSLLIRALGVSGRRRGATGSYPWQLVSEHCTRLLNAWDCPQAWKHWNCCCCVSGGRRRSRCRPGPPSHAVTWLQQLIFEHFVQALSPAAGAQAPPLSSTAGARRAGAGRGGRAPAARGGAGAVAGRAAAEPLRGRVRRPARLEARGGVVRVLRDAADPAAAVRVALARRHAVAARRSWRRRCTPCRPAPARRRRRWSWRTVGAARGAAAGRWRCWSAAAVPVVDVLVAVDVLAPVDHAGGRRLGRGARRPARAGAAGRRRRRCRCPRSRCRPSRPAPASTPGIRRETSA